MTVSTWPLPTSVFITWHDASFAAVCSFSAESPIKLHCVYRTKANKLVLRQPHTLRIKRWVFWGIKILDASMGVHILRFCIRKAIGATSWTTSNAERRSGMWAVGGSSRLPIQWNKKGSQLRWRALPAPRWEWGCRWYGNVCLMVDIVVYKLTFCCCRRHRQ